MLKLLLIFTGIIILITNVYGDLFIVEVFPNTIDDKNLEYIRLFNSGSANIDFGGYKLLDKVGKEYIFPAGEILISNIGKKFYRGETGITLNNSDEKIYLYNNLGKLIDVFSYKKSIKGEYILKSDIDLSGDNNNNNKNKIPFTSIQRRMDEIRFNNEKDENYYSNLVTDNEVEGSIIDTKKNIAFSGENNYSYEKNVENDFFDNSNEPNDVLILTDKDKYIFTFLLVVIGFMMLFIILRKDKII